jgi:hypothetical protein
MQHLRYGDRARYGPLARAACIAGTLAIAASGVGMPMAATASTRANPSAVHSQSAAACPTARWHKPPITVTRNFRVPPTPVVKAVRAAKHPRCRFDRLVFDISVRNPGYHIRYVKRVIADASGKTIKLPGKRFLLITLRPAQAHRNSGASTLPTKVQVLRFPMLKSWVLAGDSEGVVSIGVGLHAKTSVRVGELRGRLFIDFKY